MTIWILLAFGVLDALAQLNIPNPEAIVSLTSGECEAAKAILTAGMGTPDLRNLTLQHITPNKTYTYDLTSVSNVSSAEWFDPHKPLYFFVPGFTDSPSGRCFTTINKALIAADIANVMVLNTSNYIGASSLTEVPDYIKAVKIASCIAEALGEAIGTMIQGGGVNASSMWFIGHSLGAHIVGSAADTVYSRTGQTVRRVTGLDPAGPCFGLIKNSRLCKTAGIPVDIIHTNAGELGMYKSSGDVDYWPNLGNNQPGCYYNSSCSHGRACAFFAESVLNPTGFPSVNCKYGSIDFELGKCDNNDISYMGFGSEPGAEGQYYLVTNSQSPYALGTKGTKPSKVGLLA